jgi:hypothetical protein
MGPKSSSYTAQREGERPERRVVYDVKQLHLVLGIVAAVVAFFVSAASGVYLTSEKIVPPIVHRTMKPAIDRLTAADEKLREDFMRADKEGDTLTRDEAKQLRTELEATRASLDNLKTVLLNVQQRGRLQ